MVMKKGILYVVATPIGNLSDMSLRAIETLKNVSFIACEDTRQTIKLLNYYEINTKMISYHKFNEHDRSKELIDKLINGEDIAIVTDAGTPCISDPGYILVKKCRENGIEVIGIPGCSAVINALSTSGIDTKKFAFYGFLSQDKSTFNKELDDIKDNSINTVVIYESPKRLVKLIECLLGIFPNASISIHSDMTKKFERCFYGTINDVYDRISTDENIEKGEYVIILEKNLIKEENNESISLEALLVDTIVKNNCCIKDAIDIILSNDKNIRKNDLKSASLRLKNIL